MSQGFGLRPPLETLSGRRHVQRSPLSCGQRRLVLEEVSQRTHERPAGAVSTAAPHQSLAAQFGERGRRISEPTRDLRGRADLAEDRQPAQKLLNPLGRGAQDLLDQIAMESLSGVGQLSHRAETLIRPDHPEHLHSAVHGRGPTTSALPHPPRQASRIPSYGLAQ